MPRFAANISLLFTERPFLDRIEAARAAGFEGVECLFPYDFDAHEIARALKESALPLILFNTPPGNWEAGDRGQAALEGNTFAEALEQALDFAAILKPRHIHVMSGLAEGDAARRRLIANLRHACARAPKQSFLIEPINPFDMPGYFLRDFATARAVISAVAAPNLGLQFDAYHAARITGDMLACWHQHAPLARHVQVAGLPGRHEPIPSDLDYPGFFRALDRGGYAGFVSGEYFPKEETRAGLGWLSAPAS